VFWHPEREGSGFWAVTNYADVQSLSHDTRSYSSTDGVGIGDRTPAELKSMRRMMLHMDPPEHTRYRRLVTAGFTPRTANEMPPDIQSMAREIIDDVIEDGHCDFVRDIAGKLPSYFITSLMGIPREDGVILYHETELIHASTDVVTPEARAAAGAAIAAYARVSQRRNGAIQVTTSPPGFFRPRSTATS
jgi:cytochrome P450